MLRRGFALSLRADPQQFRLRVSGSRAAWQSDQFAEGDSARDVD